MHSPGNLSGLTALLCKDLLTDPNSLNPSHITLNVPLQSVSAHFRASFPANFENSFATTSFTVTPKLCIGSILVEPDGDHWLKPRLFTWNSLEQYLDLFQIRPTSEPVTWAILLAAFASVEVTWIDADWDMIEIINTTGENLATSQDLEKILSNSL